MASLFTPPQSPALLPIPAAVAAAGTEADKARVAAQAEAAMWADVREIAARGGLRGRVGTPVRRWSP